MNYEILVNKDNPIDFDYLEKTIKPLLVSIEFTRDNEDLFNEFGITDKKIYLEKETALAWNELKTFLINKGIQFDICSGYLSLEQQQNKYNNFLKRNGEALTIRYPKHKQEITKMQYEPWHIRYVGKYLANKLYKEDLTLEEYYLNKVKNISI